MLRHEAAHLLAGYLYGVPVTAYSLDLGTRIVVHQTSLWHALLCRQRVIAVGRAAVTGRAHTDFAEAKLQRRLIEGSLEDSEIDTLSVVALAGAAAEATQYEEVLCLVLRSVKWTRNLAAVVDTVWYAGDRSDSRLD